MKVTRLSPYLQVGFILICLAVLIVVILFITNRGDVTSATLILVAFTSFFAGLFILSFSSEQQIDRNVAGLMAVPYTVNFSRVLADLGVSGSAHFIPVPDNDAFAAKVMQFNPVATNVPEQFSADLTFFLKGENSGVLTVPSGIPLLTMMEQNHSISIPAIETGMYEMIREVNEDSLEIAHDVTVDRSGNSIVIVLKNFQLFSGCISARKESPRTCLVAPCPVCSLAGVLVAHSLGKTAFMEQVLIDEKAGRLVVFIGLKD